MSLSLSCKQHNIVQCHAGAIKRQEQSVPTFIINIRDAFVSGFAKNKIPIKKGEV